jgi:hypothetical protein
MSRLPLTFRIQRPGQPVREETLSLAVIKIGKVPSAHLRLDDESVSRMHAIFEIDLKGTVHVIDLGSTRGTYVNGQRVNKAQVMSGDVLKVGDVTIDVSFAAAQSQAAPEPRPEPSPAPARASAPAPLLPPPAVAAAVPPPVPAAPPPVPAAPPMPPLGLGLGVATEPTDGHAIEVAALFDESLVSVKHCMDPRGGRVRAATMALLAAGAIGFVAASLAFVGTAVTAHRNADALDAWTHVAHKPAWSFRPEQPGLPTDVVVTGGLGMAVIGLGLGLARLRRERVSPYFRIGTAPGVEHPTEHAPAASFPLVAPSGDDFVLNVGPGMTGELVVDNTTTPLAALAGLGRAQPSAHLANTLEVPIPPRARIRARAGASTFVVTSVPQPKREAIPSLMFDGRTAMYIAGSLAVHLALWGAIQFGSDSMSSVGLQLDGNEAVDARWSHTNPDDPPPPAITETGTNDSRGQDSSGGATAMADGVRGTPDSTVAQAHMRVAMNDPMPKLSRERQLDEVRRSGFFMDDALSESIRTVTGGDDDISSQFDKATYYGTEFGADGDSRGFGMGRYGNGPGGGCTNNCGGIGAGRYNTIGDGHKAGHDFGLGGTGGGGLPGHHPRVPTGSVGLPVSVGDGLDKAIIRRYIMQRFEKLRYCYEKQLLVQAGLEGDVSVSFLIQPNGTVQGAVGQATGGMKQEVASCAADVIGAIEFPAPKDGGSVQVRFPLRFHPTGADK